MTDGPASRPSRRKGDEWHLDKNVPIGLILALLVQTAGMVWWSASLNSQVGEHERRLLSIEATDDHRGREMNAIEGRLASLEATGDAQLGTLRRIEGILDRLILDGRFGQSPLSSPAHE